MRTTKTVTIASGQTVSSAALTEGDLVGIRTPAALTGTSITFQTAFEDQVFLPYKKPATGNPVSMAVAADGSYGIVPSDFKSFDYIKIVSGSTEAADRTFTLIFEG